VPGCLRRNHTALLHEDLGREKPALAVLVIDQRQPALIRSQRLVAPARMVGVEDLPDPIRIAAPVIDPVAPLWGTRSRGRALSKDGLRQADDG